MNNESYELCAVRLILTTTEDNMSEMSIQSEHNEAEIRLMGLILAQSALVGLSIGVFDANLWLISDNAVMNGFTYAMAAFFVQGIAYYFFKMFFEQNMQDRVRMTTMERERQMRYRGMQHMFDQRRSEMELRIQEKQLEAELQWMEENPGKAPPSWVGRSVLSDETSNFNPGTPAHKSSTKGPLNLGTDNKDKEK